MMERFNRLYNGQELSPKVSDEGTSNKPIDGISYELDDSEVHYVRQMLLEKTVSIC